MLLFIADIPRTGVKNASIVFEGRIGFEEHFLVRDYLVPGIYARKFTLCYTMDTFPSPEKQTRSVSGMCAGCVITSAGKTLLIFNNINTS